MAVSRECATETTIFKDIPYFTRIRTHALISAHVPSKRPPARIDVPLGETKYQTNAPQLFKQKEFKENLFL